MMCVYVSHTLVSAPVSVPYNRDRVSANIFVKYENNRAYDEKITKFFVILTKNFEQKIILSKVKKFLYS